MNAIRDIVVLYKVSQPTPTATIFFEQLSALNERIKGPLNVCVQKCPELSIVYPGLATDLHTSRVAQVVESCKPGFGDFSHL